MTEENTSESERVCPRLSPMIRWGLAALLVLPWFVSIGPSNRHGSFPELSQGARRTPGVLLFEPTSAEDLARVLDKVWGAAEDQAIPNLAPSRFPPDMGTLGTGERKRLFVQSVLPHILEANRRIGRERSALLGALNRTTKGMPPTSVETTWMMGLARRYGVAEDAASWIRTDPSSFMLELLLRVDEVPPSLALAQAAVESAWGSSRFALEGNALFGQWVFSTGTGMVPKARPQGASFRVRRFATVADSVDAYLQNLNSLWAYEPFRKLRAKLRRAKGNLDPYQLARGLLMYSERREEYVEEVCQVIRTNRFVRFDPADTRLLNPSEVDEILSVSDVRPISTAAWGSSRPDA